MYESYDRLVEIENSSWIEELKIYRMDKYQYFPSKHYVMYLLNDGLIEVISQNCKIYIEDDLYEFWKIK